LSGLQTQYVGQGWALSGVTDQEMNDQGDGASVELSLSENAKLTWNWSTNFQVNAYSYDYGSVAGFTNGWHEQGAVVSITGAADPYYHFSSWLGDYQTSFNPLQLTVSQPTEVWAWFEPILTANGVPQPWLADHGWTENFNQIEMEDSDGDGMLTWEEYIAGTNPTNPLSALFLNMQGGGDAPVRLSWDAVPDREYTLYWSTNLINGVPRMLFNAESWTPMSMLVEDVVNTNQPTIYYWLKAAY